MPHQEHNDWPSFETVLRDVAPDSPAARSLASTDRRAKYAESASAIRAAKPAVVPTKISPLATPQERDSNSFSEARETPSITTPSTPSTDFPAPLEPLEIDTSSIRALIEPQGGPSPALDDPALDALQPLPALEVELYEELEPDLLDRVIDQDSALDLFENQEPEVLSEDATLAVDEPYDSSAQHTETVDTVEHTETVDTVEHTETVAPAFDPVADGVEFGSSTPWATETNFGDDDSLVFELDDSTISEVDAAHAAEEHPSELTDPFFDADAEPQASVDDDIFSTTDIPELPDPNPLDDPFGGVSTDLSPDPVASELPLVADEAIEHPNGSLWNVSFDDNEPSVVDVNELAVDELGTIEIPDVTQISYGESELEFPEAPDTAELFDTAEAPDTAESFDDLASMADGKIDLSDINESDELAEGGVPVPDEIDQREAGLFDFSGSEKIQLPGDEAEFDSVAAAEEIEGHLESLLNLEEETSADLDNVIPLRRDIDLQADFHNELSTNSADGTTDSDDHSADNTLDHTLEQFDTELLTDDSKASDNDRPTPSHNGWVSLPPEAKAEEPDPWAHMRPTEEPKKKGFWANRPKFFGGDERRRARAERVSIPESTLDDEVGISYEKACPNCGTDCEVDLDDPVGRRVHVSCPSCQHMWHTPYIIEETQTG